MQILDPSFIVLDNVNGEEVLKKIERCARVCYKSENRITENSHKKFVAGLIKSGHESILEHVSITVKFIISRAIANEIVRHRIASYSQESSRYCNYKELFLYTPYLATINNLASPVIKTADKTMKITYTLTETKE